MNYIDVYNTFLELKEILNQKKDAIIKKDLEVLEILMNVEEEKNTKKS